MTVTVPWLGVVWPVAVIDVPVSLVRRPEAATVSATPDAVVPVSSLAMGAPGSATVTMSLAESLVSPVLASVTVAVLVIVVPGATPLLTVWVKVKTWDAPAARPAGQVIVPQAYVQVPAAVGRAGRGEPGRCAGGGDGCGVGHDQRVAGRVVLTVHRAGAVVDDRDRPGEAGARGGGVGRGRHGDAEVVAVDDQEALAVRVAVTPLMSVVPVVVARSTTEAVLVIVAQGAVLAVICW